MASGEQAATQARTSARADVTEDHLPLAVPAGLPPVNFGVHLVRAGNLPGARDDFEQMLGQLVRATKPGGRLIAANPGDWGIDVLAGELGGEVIVWQAKFFWPVTTKAKRHDREIRDSFQAAYRAAEDHGHELHQWVLCLPSSMDGPTAKWWDGWRNRTQNQCNVAIVLWDENELRGQLLSPDAVNVHRAYYGSPYPPTETEERRLISPTDEASTQLDAALFVRQLREVGYQEVNAAKEQFFNADLLAREIVDKGLPTELQALTAADFTVHGLWEAEFNSASSSDDDINMHRLYSTVCDRIRQAHPQLPRTLRATVIHAWGLMHRIVEDRRAGWARNWRQVVVHHMGTLPHNLPDSGATNLAKEPTSAPHSTTADKLLDAQRSREPHQKLSSTLSTKPQEGAPYETGYSP